MPAERTRLIGFTLWLAAFLVTASLAVFQRATGPSYPLRGSFETADGAAAAYRLPRSNEGRGALRVAIPEPGGGREAVLEWRRYPTDESHRLLPMQPLGDGRVAAEIPLQPAAGKVEYKVRIGAGADAQWLPSGDTVVARFRDPVPAAVLVPHILAMFGSMLVSTRALLEVLRPGRRSARGLVLTAMGLLAVGGLVLGPLVQKAAFGAYWTGWPLGTDLTDNKTAIAVLAWLVPTVAVLRKRRSRIPVLVGWVVMMGIFLIPHSMRGSQLDWSEAEAPAAVAGAAGAAGAAGSR